MSIMTLNKKYKLVKGLPICLVYDIISTWGIQTILQADSHIQALSGTRKAVGIWVGGKTFWRIWPKIIILKNVFEKYLKIQWLAEFLVASKGKIQNLMIKQLKPAQIKDFLTYRRLKTFWRSDFYKIFWNFYQVSPLWT